MAVLILDVQRGGDLPLSEVVQGAIRGGIGMVILRDRRPYAELFLQHALELREMIPPSIPFLVNDRLDIALAAKADGVHLPEHGFPVAHARRLMPPGAWVGRSVHSLDAATSAFSAGVDYLLVGTMFSTSSKPGRTPDGPEILKAIHKQVSTPLIGIGGIHASNANIVMQAGAKGVAVVTAVTHASDPKRATQKLVDAIHRSHADDS